MGTDGSPWRAGRRYEDVSPLGSQTRHTIGAELRVSEFISERCAACRFTGGRVPAMATAVAWLRRLQRTLLDVRLMQTPLACTIS